MTEQQNRQSKSKLLTYILRHHPDKYNLKLDKNGWIDINILLNEINISKQNKVGNISYNDIIEIVKLCEKQRFQLDETKMKIRANQGHSIEVDLEFEEKNPPKILFHGTCDKIIDIIFEQGINKMARHHVHMSENIISAIQVGKRRGNPIIIIINSQQMHDDGIKFYISNNNVWLTDYVDKKYISLFKVDDKCGCGGFVILNYEKTKCLLVKANNWGFPKGKKNKYESILQCALRELEEETSLKETDIVIDYNYQMMFELSNNNCQAVGLFVAYTKEDNEVKIQDEDELSEIKWFVIQEAYDVLNGVKNRKQLLESVINKN
jgi:putative RNA 2'-phosphotransferase